MSSTLLTPELLDQIEEEMLKAKHDHGEVPDDLTRICTLIGEEFGEVARAILEYTRIQWKPDVEMKDLKLKKAQIRLEAIHLISLSVYLIDKVK